ncbi:hypothetical protein [Bacillus velezensis]|uniref:hypothetical protein n=1 Tax=Bacillus velezensis TaxID=492670 RepID=UPI0015F00DD5|nr:hypothetical protein [Bacillus velezensis]QMI88315.1 hypothetical protein H1Q60_19745 [Bacillus velezensis]
MAINLKIRKNEADKPKVKEIENGYFYKINDVIRCIQEFPSGACVTVDLSDLSVRYFADIKELKKVLNAKGSEVEVIRPKQANVNIGFEWRQ